MCKYEYIKFYWKYIDDDTPILIFYEIDLEADRYATRMVEVFWDRKVHPIVESGFDYITEAPVPKIDDINADEDFFAEIITKEQFENVYYTDIYSGEIDFPK